MNSPRSIYTQVSVPQAMGLHLYDTYQHKKCSREYSHLPLVHSYCCYFRFHFHQALLETNWLIGTLLWCPHSNLERMMYESAWKLLIFIETVFPLLPSPVQCASTNYRSLQIWTMWSRLFRYPMRGQSACVV